MPTAGPYYASANAAASGGLAAWTNPQLANEVGEPNETNYASAAPARNANIANNWLFGTQFSGVPDSATIDSITATARVWSDTTASGTDVVFAAQLYDGATAIGSEVSSTTVGRNLTFQTWTPPLATLPSVAQLKSSTFAIRLRTLRSGTTARTMRLAWLTFSVTYTEGGASLSKTATDTLSVDDGVGQTRTLSRSATENLPLADIVARTRTLARSASDTLSLADALSRGLARSRSISDALSLAATATASRGLGKAASDSLPLSDNLIAATAKGVADALLVADSVSYQRSLARSASDTLSLADALQKALSINRTLSETLPVSDSVLSALGLSRSASDGIGLDDTLSEPTRILLRNISDTLPLLDLVSYEGTGQKNKSVADTLALDDTLSTQRTLARTLSDNLVLFDAVAYARDIQQQAVDELALSDVLTRELVIQRIVTDALLIADSLSVEGVNVIPKIEGVTPSQRVLVSFQSDSTLTSGSDNRILQSNTGHGSSRILP